MKTTPDSQLEFNLGEGEVETDVSIETEVPEETPESAQAAAPEPESQRSELDAVSDAVQKRISNSLPACASPSAVSRQPWSMPAA